MRALVVDDSTAMRSILKRILEELGSEVYLACHGGEGMHRLKEIGSADLTLVDWNMPHMNGLEFVRAVRAVRSYDKMRVVMVTSESEVEQIVKALESGADDYITKPFTKSLLLQRLQRLGLLKAASDEEPSVCSL